MPWNEDLPEWTEAGVAPPGSKRAEGWLEGERPPAGWFNWLLHRTYACLVEIRDRLYSEGATDGDALVWNDSEGRWEPGPPGADAAEFAAHLEDYGEHVADYGDHIVAYEPHQRFDHNTELLYDVDGNLETVNTYDSMSVLRKTEALAYDLDGNLETVTVTEYADDGVTVVVTYVETLTYDAAGDLTGVGRVVA